MKDYLISQAITLARDNIKNLKELQAVIGDVKLNAQIQSNTSIIQNLEKVLNNN